MIALPAYIDREAWGGFEDQLSLLLKALERVRYVPETGEFVRLVFGSHNAKPRADLPMATGYRVVHIGKRRVLAHRLALMMSTLRPILGEIDHINRDKADNRIGNLRESSHADNCKNQIQRRKSGVYGVAKPKHTKRFRAYISVQQKFVHLGYFDTQEEAHMVAVEASRRLKGDFFPNVDGGGHA